MQEYEPNPMVVKRAVELWVATLNNPKYDNGANDLPNITLKA